MHDVARWKWNAGKPIIDERREHEMLTDLEQRGRKLGLDRSRTRAFFSAQIDAGKRIQEADFTHWREQDHGQFAEARDLTTDLRPALDALNSELLAQLAALASRLERPEVRAAIGRRAADLPRGEGIDDAVRSTALRPLIDDQP